MHSAVLIPFSHEGDVASLAWTLEGYRQQQLASGHTMEVHVGVDGGSLPNADTLATIGILIHPLPKTGAAGIRNILAQKVNQNTELLIWGNADARPDPDMVQQHADAMAKLPPRYLVLGAAPWERIAPTVLDALIDHMPMIFSYCHMKPHVCYDFRCAYTINLSVRRQDFVEAGGFHEQIRPVYYEDLAFGCRLLGPDRKAIWHEPAARVLHRHPLTFDQYLDREELLGLMAPVVARHCSPAFARLMANRSVDVITRDFQRWSRGNKSIYPPLYRKVRRACELPEHTLGQGESRMSGMTALHQLHIPLKLLAFRLGFLRGLDLVDDEHWQTRQPQGLWRSLVEP